MQSGVLACGELTEEGHLAGTTREYVTVAKKLARELAESVYVAIPGSKAREYGKEVAKLGVDKVYALENHSLDDPSNFGAYVSAIEQLVKEVQPRVVVTGRSLVGRDVGPRLAYRLGTDILQDCVEVWVDEDSKNVVANRPVYGGIAMLTVEAQGEIQVVAIRPMTFDQAEVEGSAAMVIPFDVRVDDAIDQTKLVKREKEKVAGARLEDADVVVGGGRGMGGAELFRQLEELARMLGGAVCASRPPCDAGWVPASYHIGLTGKTIAPKLYIAFGISGASQHVAGCSASKTIVVVNKDPEAHFFEEADYGVKADLKEFLPSFMKNVKKLLSDQDNS
ncbi:electron transfer flavoprotein subunit alpha/FixB family protein [Chloroflexota bacterium]